MNQDPIFRTVLVVAFFALISIGLYHRVKSQATGEKLDRRQEGLFVLVALRAVGVACWLAVIAYMVNPAWMAWASLPLPTWLRWTGVGVCAIALALLTWTLHILGPNLTDTVVTRRAHTLVTHGPYRWVRHPFYDTAGLLLVAISLMTANWFVVLTGCAVFCLLVVRTRTEEDNLLARFGDEYRAYVMRTGRFVPRDARTRYRV